MLIKNASSVKLSRDMHEMTNAVLANMVAKRMFDHGVEMEISLTPDTAVIHGMFYKMPSTIAVQTVNGMNIFSAWTLPSDTDVAMPIMEMKLTPADSTESRIMAYVDWALGQDQS